MTEDLYVPGMREFQPDICWRLLDRGRRCCILKSGHDGGAHDRPAGENATILVGSLRVSIDYQAEAVYVDRLGSDGAALATRDLGNGFLVDVNADDHNQVLGVEIIS